MMHPRMLMMLVELDCHMEISGPQGPRLNCLENDPIHSRFPRILLDCLLQHFPAEPSLPEVGIHSG